MLDILLAVFASLTIFSISTCIYWIFKPSKILDCITYDRVSSWQKICFALIGVVAFFGLCLTFALGFDGLLLILPEATHEIIDKYGHKEESSSIHSGISAILALYLTVILVVLYCKCWDLLEKHRNLHVTTRRIKGCVNALKAGRKMSNREYLAEIDTILHLLDFCDETMNVKLPPDE